jgi:hypothetical protein
LYFWRIAKTAFLSGSGVTGGWLIGRGGRRWFVGRIELKLEASGWEKLRNALKVRQSERWLQRITEAGDPCPYSKLRKPKKSWRFFGIQSFE